MSNITSNKIWKKWYPDELKSEFNISTVKPIVNQKKMLYQLKKNKSQRDPSNKKEINNLSKNKDYSIAYNEGLKKGEEIGYKIGIEQMLSNNNKNHYNEQNKINSILSNFESELNAIDDVIVPKLVQLVLKVTAKIIGETHLIKESMILNKIKEILKTKCIICDKPKLIINPNDKNLVEKHFKKIFNTYGWKIICNKDIHSGGCKIESEGGNVDSTLTTYWRELCKLSLLNENYS
ncbi:flagellar assembly protein FliH [Buchnera aphidicola (Formosaphis micheliae)]|uniref:flagellar assembly protein FliH n=1 Tax=Buchnera aphidicola TaxID=9 RepID=UPI0031B864FC